MLGTSRPDRPRGGRHRQRRPAGDDRPGLLPVLAPVVIGRIFRLIPEFGIAKFDSPMAIGAMLMVGTIAGILVASYMNNAGAGTTPRK